MRVNTLVKAGIAGLGIWLLGLGLFVLGMARIFNVHSGPYWMPFAGFAWTFGVPIVVSLQLRRVHLRQR